MGGGERDCCEVRQNVIESRLTGRGLIENSQIFHLENVRYYNRYC